MDTRMIGVAEFIGGAAIIAIGLFVAATARTRRANRLLAVLFIVDGLAQIVWGAHDYARGAGRLAEIAIQLGVLLTGIASMLYLLLARRLATPLVRPLHMPLVIGACSLLIVGGSAAVGVYLQLHPGSISIVDSRMDPGVRVYLATFALGMLLAYSYSLVAAISAWRRAPVGTAMRKRAGAFALAFGARDAFLLLAVVLNILGAVVLGANAESAVAYALWPAGTLVYAALLAYGLLRLQLFDLDLRLKWSISRGTVVGIILVAVFVVAKVVEAYLSRTVGFVAGSIVAGVLLFLVPKLNKVGEKVANTALPQVQPTSEYLTFKKLEVYKAAVESAMETGNEIDASERHMLNKLHVKLGLSDQDAAAIEAELVPAASN